MAMYRLASASHTGFEQEAPCRRRRVYQGIGLDTTEISQHNTNLSDMQNVLSFKVKHNSLRTSSGRSASRAHGNLEGCICRHPIEKQPGVTACKPTPSGWYLRHQYRIIDRTLRNMATAYETNPKRKHKGFIPDSGQRARWSKQRRVGSLDFVYPLLPRKPCSRGLELRTHCL